VKNGQLLVELVLGLREFVKPHHRWASAAWWRGAGSESELLKADATQTLHSRVGSHCRAVCVLRVIAGPEAAGRAQVVDVGRHRVVREAGLSMGVHRGTPLHELPPSKRLSSACLEGEVGEVVGCEPKTLLRWIRP
jgi:hypothetical protein